MRPFELRFHFIFVSKSVTSSDLMESPNSFPDINLLLMIFDFCKNFYTRKYCETRYVFAREINLVTLSTQFRRCV